MLRILAVHGRATIAARGRVPLSLRLVAVVLWVAPRTTSWLWNIGDNLHASGDYSGRTTTASRVGGRRWAPKSLSQLLDKGASNVVSGNVNRISNAKDNKRTLRGERKTRIRRVEASARGFLDLTDADTALANDGANEDVRDEKAEGVSLGLWG